MNAASLEQLFLKQNQEPTAADLSKLSAQIAIARPLNGLHVRQRVMPWGTHTNVDGGGGSVFSSSIFAPTVGRSDRNFLVSWRFGLIAGREPTIDGEKISGTDKSNPPAFTVTPAAFSEEGTANVYFRVTFDANWGATKVEPFASPDTPFAAPYQADKLALILGRDGAVVHRALYMDQSHLALNPRPNGIAQHIWSAVL